MKTVHDTNLGAWDANCIGAKRESSLTDYDFWRTARINGDMRNYDQWWTEVGMRERQMEIDERTPPDGPREEQDNDG